MSLPDDWTDKIFQKLTLAYGRDFTGRYEGIPLEEVKADWAHELSGYLRSPHSLAYALQHLPNKPPNVFEFRAICCNAPSEPMPALEGPVATYTPAVRDAALAEVRALLKRAKTYITKDLT